MYKEYDARVEEILSSLSLKEKIGQLNQAVIPLDYNIEAGKERIRNGEVGSIILANSATAGNDEQQAVMVDALNEFQKCAVEESASKIPLIYGRDVIHGHHTVYPIPLASACSFNRELVRQCYRYVAEEATSESIHWTFSPMMDICRDPRWGRIIEGMGEDPYLASEIVRATVKGLQGDDLSEKNSMLACAKHYVGYGASEGGRDYHRTEISDYTLYNYILPPFRAAVEEGVGTVMSSFNDINGEPVTSSKKYLTDILRGKLGFEGYVVSDWYSVDQLVRQGVAEDKRDCTRMALTAGLDMDMADEVYFNNLEELVLSGEVPMEVLDEAVRRVLRIKMAKGLFDDPYYVPHHVDRTKHLEAAEQLAAESMVLIKNDGVLPLEKKPQLVCIGGPFVDEIRGLHGSWALDGYLGASTPTFRQAMEEVVGEGGGWLDSVCMGMLDDTTYHFKMADVIVLALGESHTVTGEARCRSDISLPIDQLELAKKAKLSGKKVIGVMFMGRPLALESVMPYLDAVLVAWHGGTRCAHAAARTLFGDYNPSGRASVTFVRTTGHIPLYYNVTSSGREVNGYYGERPHCCYVDCEASPLIPFGYGLSYTEYEYGDVEVDTTAIELGKLKLGDSFKVAVKVKNVGERSGKETVQLYVRDLVASMMRPLRELKGFEKIELKAGEEKEVVFEVGAKSLGFYNSSGDYVIERGKFEIYVGNCCLTENKVVVEVI